MQLMRRGVIAQRKVGFVWAVYELAMGIDESAGGTSGSVSLTSTRYKRVAKSYTVSSSGTVSLVDSVQTTVANMAVGDYLVNVSTSNNTSTTGTTLYKITAISGTTTRKITYTAYTPSLCVKGEDTGERVESADGTKYPHHGAQGDYYYVLLRGWTNQHTWQIYNVKETVATYKSVRTTRVNTSIPSSKYSYGTNYDFNTSTGKYTLTGGSTNVTFNSITFNGMAEEGDLFWMSGSSNSGTTMYVGGYASTTTISNTTRYTSEPDTYSYGKGTATGNTATDLSRYAYPDDGQLGDKWYVYNGVEQVYIDNT